MAPRLKQFGNALITCVAVAWLGYQALYGDGGLRISSIALLIVGAVTAVGAILDHVLPRPKRRRSLEKRD
ncbi:hypothetical protein [Streptomyces sp. WM6386]|uniref:hypothetical protein n=1 Tax=Streptomyces sp. WM6386 TaxID=1415558 RepID=UPI000619F70D|nr:hypothetical protein [Streptomyces sp. WM6386]KKD06439.1 hypothetical protein TN53_19015 [Streptomyces sp. WM6386]